MGNQTRMRGRGRMRGGRVHGTPTTAMQAKCARDRRCLHARKMTWNKSASRGAHQVDSLPRSTFLNSYSRRALAGSWTIKSTLGTNVFLQTLESIKKLCTYERKAAWWVQDAVLWLWLEKKKLCTYVRAESSMAWPIQVIDKWDSMDRKKSPLCA